MGKLEPPFTEEQKVIFRAVADGMVKAIGSASGEEASARAYYFGETLKESAKLMKERRS